MGIYGKRTYYHILERGLTDYEIYAESIIEKFYQHILIERPAFKRLIIPWNLLRPIIVQPQRLNSRMVSQEIIVNNRDIILDELDSIGINEATLFPEIDNVANYLKSML